MSWMWHFSKRFDAHTRELLGDGAVALLLKVIGTLLMFVVQVVAARYLGAADAGIYFVVLAIITTLATVARIGMDNIVTRLVAANAMENNWLLVGGVVALARRITLIGSLVLVAAVLVCSEWIGGLIFKDETLAWPLIAASLLILPLSLTAIYASALQGMKKTRDVMLLQSVLIPLITIPFLFVLIPRLGVNGALVAYGGGVICTMVVALLLWRRMNIKQQVTLTRSKVGEMVNSSTTLLGAVMMQQFMQVLPLLLLAVWNGSEEAGVFSVAQRSANLVGLVLMAANIIAAPRFAELYQKNDMEALGGIAKKTTGLLILMAIPSVFLFLLFPKWVMGLFGAEFVSGWILLVIMALGQLANVLTGSVGYLLIMTGQEKNIFTTTWISLLICAVTALVLIPVYGAIGAALSAAIATVISNLLRVRYAWVTLRLSTIPFMR